MLARIRWFPIVVFTSLLLGLIFRLSNWSFFGRRMVEGHFNFLDTDCYYHLRRLVYFLENFPSILKFDALSDWPTGGPVDWGPGFLWLIGLPLKLFGVSSFYSLELGASALMVVLGLTTCWLVWWAGQRMLSSSFDRGILLLVVCTNFFLIRFSCLGQVDHHLLEALFPALFLGLAFNLAEHQDVQSMTQKACWLAAGLLAVYSLTVSSSSLFSIIAFLLSYAWVWGERGSARLAIAWMFLPLVSAMTALSYWNFQTTKNWLTMDHLSLFHTSSVAVLSLAAIGSLYFKPKTRLLLSFVGGLLLGLFIYLDLVPQFGGAARSALAYVFGRKGILGQVGEAQFIFMSFDGLDFSFLLASFGYLFFLLLAPLPLLIFKRELLTSEKTLFLMLFLLSIPGIFQKRFAQLMIGLYLILSVWCLSQVLAWIRSKQLKLAKPVVVLFVGLMILPAIEAGLAPGGKPRDLVDGSIASLFVKHLKQEGLTDERVWSRLAGREKVLEGVWGNPNLGHLIQYLTGFGVVTNSFYHWEGLRSDDEMRSIEADQDFLARLQRDKIRYALLTDDFAYMEMLDKMQNRGPSAYIERSGNRKDGSDKIVFRMDMLEKRAWVRALTGKSSFEKKAWEQIFGGEIRVYYPLYRFVRGIKLKELPP